MRAFPFIPHGGSLAMPLRRGRQPHRAQRYRNAFAAGAAAPVTDWTLYDTHCTERTSACQPRTRRATPAAA